MCVCQNPDNTSMDAMLQKCDSLIRSGNLNQAILELDDLQVELMSRAQIFILASLFRRTGQITKALRVIWPFVRPDRDLHLAAPEAHELSEYAVLLLRNGNVQESFQILGKLDSSRIPMVDLNRALCLFNIWEYPKAVFYLRNFLSNQLEPYQRVIGEVNLSASLVAVGETSEALEILNKLITDNASNVRLLGNALELRAQCYIKQDKLRDASATLQEAASLFSKKSSWDYYLVTKWQRVIQSLSSNDPQPILQFQREALERRDWEGIREADLFLLKVKLESSLLDQLYYGTPYPFYRERIQKLLNTHPTDDSCLIGGSKTNFFDVETGRFSKMPNLNPGKKTHQILDVLTRDLYKPLRTGGLFALLFDGEHFDFLSSPGRVHQSIRRARAWMEENKIPLKIEHFDGNFKLVALDDMSLKIPLVRNSINGFNANLILLKNQLDENENLTAQNIKDQLKLSPSSVKRFLRWAQQENKIQKQDGRRGTYKFSKSS